PARVYRHEAGLQYFAFCNREHRFRTGVGSRCGRDYATAKTPARKGRDTCVGMKWSSQFFEGLFDIRMPEVGRALLMSTYLLLGIASYSVPKAVRDSLFVTQIGPAPLPYVYLLIAAAMGLLSIGYSRAVNRIGLYRLIQTTSLIAISNLVLFLLVFRSNSSVWFYVLYVWGSLFGAITASQFWLLATHVFNPREARRVFSWIGVGGILGGVFGGALTNRMAHWLGTESLLLVCAGMMAATVVLLARVAHMSAGSHINGGVPNSETHEPGATSPKSEP